MPLRLINQAFCQSFLLGHFFYTPDPWSKDLIELKPSVEFIVYILGLS